MAGYIISPADFQKAMNEMLEEFGDDAISTAKITVKDVAERATQKMRSSSNGGFSGVKYRKSWKYSFEYSKQHMAVVARVYNDKHYRLTHLLEFGHAKRGGGRTRPFPHIAPVNNWVGDEFIKQLNERISQL